MRIYKTKLYTVTGSRFINRLAGHQHTERFETVLFGAFVRTRTSISDTRHLFRPDSQKRYRIDDGHLPDYQPITTGDKLKAEMQRIGAIQAFRIS